MFLFSFCHEFVTQNSCLSRTLTDPYGCCVCFQMQPQLLPKDLTMQWFFSASGTYGRAARQLAEDVTNSNLDDIEMCRIINDRIMAVSPPQLCSS